LTEPLLFIDEDFPLDTAKALRERGFVVVATVETGIRGLPDREQLQRAAEMNAFFVSNNYTERHKFAAYAHELQEAGFADVTAVLLPHEPPDGDSCSEPRCSSPGIVNDRRHVPPSSSGIISHSA
jgi:hypothetical protein